MAESALTSRERMHAAIEGREIDQIPIAPCFWMAEYSWKLTGLPIWQVLHGPGDMQMKVVEALDERHGCDWILPNHCSTKKLVNKTKTGEDLAHVYFVDDETGEEWVFHKEGHWALPKGQIHADNECKSGMDIEPPKNKAEADDWMKQHMPNVFNPPKPRTEYKRYRDRFPDRFISGGLLHVFANLTYTLGFEPTLILLSENPSLCAYILEKTCEALLPNQVNNIVICDMDAGLMTDSFASADIMSPETYKNYVAPFHKMVADECHKAGKKAIMYNTGNILPFLSTIKNLGFDAILPEERIKGIEINIGEVRRQIGDDMCIFGNFDSYLLLRGDRERIKEEVQRQIYEAGPKRFVMSTGSPVCDDTDPDVIDFWIEETRNYKFA